MSLAEPPILSVIIPVWNGARYLAEAIASVLAQEAPPLEVLVVDDGSTDDSAAVAERFGGPVRCLRRPHAGLAAARNAGLDAARGAFLLHLDADDLLPPGSIAVRMAVLTARPDVGLVVGFLESFLSPELDAETAARFAVPGAPQPGGLPGASLVRARFAARVGRFDTSLPGSPDLDWMMRAHEQGTPPVVISDLVLRRRIHGQNLSLTAAGVAGRLQILQAALHRRRAAAESSER